MRKALLFCSCLFICFAAIARENNTPTPESFANKKAPLSFMENKGQITDQNYQPRPDIQFQLKAANGLTIFVGNGAIHYQFAKADRIPEPRKPEDRFDPKKMMEHDSTTFTMYRMDMELIGANKHAKIITEDRQDYYENYYTTGTGENGVTVYAYSKITYKDIYPNIDWVLYTKNNELKHEFIVRQGGNPADIKLKYGGATNLNLQKDGSLEATTPQGTITEEAPVSYTQEGQQVISSFSLKENVLSYEVGNYEGTLVIDPSLVWATYFGGSGNDEAHGVVTDLNNNIYITGSTQSSNNIATSGAYIVSYVNSGNSYLAKFSPTCQLLWGTYSGVGNDDISIDNNSNLIVTGNGSVAKFSNTGNFIWATYTPGLESHSCKTDNNGNVFICGTVQGSNSYLGVSNAYQSIFGGGGSDAFLIKLNNSGVIQWSTYFGGNEWEGGEGVDVTNSGDVLIIGTTGSSQGIASISAYQYYFGGGSGDAFIAKFSNSGTLLWSSYYGGSNNDYGRSISTDNFGNVFLVGQTKSNNDIADSNSYFSNYVGSNGWGDGFISKFNSYGQKLWSTYLGTAGSVPYSSCIDEGGNVCITGSTMSSFGIANPNAIKPYFTGGIYSNAFLMKFSNNGSFIYGTYYGGSGSNSSIANINDEEALGIASDNNKSLVLVGFTYSSVGFATSNAFDTIGQAQDAFLVKINFFNQTFAGNDTAICKGDSIIIGKQMEADHIYSWSSIPSSFTSNQSNSIVVPNTSTQYVLKDSISGNFPSFDTVVVTVNPLPTINAGVDVLVCAGDSVLLTATSNASNISWNNGVINNKTFLPSIGLVSSGTNISSANYVATATDVNGCINSDTVQVTVNPLPTAFASTTNTAICPNGNTTLTASGGVGYLWNNGDTSATTTVTQPGNYYVIAMNQYGCTDTSNAITITQKTLPTQVKIKAAGATSVCEPATVAFVLDMPLGSTTGFGYQWYLSGSPIVGATDSFYNANTTGSYALSVYGGDNCSKFSYTKPATIKPAPNASFTATSPTTICSGGFVTLVAPTISGCTYTWLKDGVSAGVGSTKLFKVSGNYTVIAKINGCSDTASPSIPIVVNPLPIASVTAINATTFCAGDSCTIAASPIGAVSYEWHNGNFILDTTTTEQYTIGITATIKVLVKDANGCIGKLSTTNVKTKANVIPLASISSSGSTTISSTGSVKLKATPSSGVTWQWYKDGNAISNATANSYIATAGGTYTVAITKLGCTGTSSGVVVTQTTPKENAVTTIDGSFEMSAYPNPVSEVLTVTISGLETIDGIIQVMDMSGKLITSKACHPEPVEGSSNTGFDKLSLTTENWSSGVYLIRYKDNEGRTGTVKVVKE